MPVFHIFNIVIPVDFESNFPNSSANYFNLLFLFIMISLNWKTGVKCTFEASVMESEKFKFL